ncbi:MAG: amino acid adenylation domain-containing protein [Alphaproteobacteria bacterium]|nr:amino acid adenylation domain-containing protein [Alphaproteobacteria bacterium]
MISFWEKFSDIVAQYPEAIAIEDGDKHITYATLAERAGQIGAHLRGQGAGPETPVALEMEKSADYITAMLGCWHAGAAFVPLPPSLPQQRRDHIMKHADIRHTLTSYDLEKIQSHDNTPPATLSKDILAYIIYTSGSTGAPKGVMIEHRGIVRFMEAQIKSFNLNPGNRALFYLSILFDAAISDIGTALLSGATLVIPSQEMVRNGAQLIKGLHEQRITHMDVPPSLLKAFSLKDMPDSLETIIIGGEACPPETVRQWAEKFRIINVYGPTEATVCTSLCQCDAETWDTPLIGDPLPGVIYDISDDGELYISGDCLARGYLNDTKLTDSKFIQHKGQRAYRTGDKVRRLDCGGIAFLGRIDRQFKLRGQLVEPDEIEACLHAHPALQKAAVIKRSERLVAFLSVKEPLLVSGIAAHLKKSLPTWMIPQDFIFPDTWPLTPTGKTDTAALAKLPVQHTKKNHIPPQTENEQKLWDIWRDILKHDDFGITDDFFAIGGDSLDIIRMTLDAERQGLPLTAATLATNRTIQKITQNAEKQADAVSTTWLKNDVAFDSDWQNLFKTAQNRTTPPNIPPKHILITGAAGFLGGRLLHELLERTDAHIHCIVRATDNAAAMERIKKSLLRFLPEISPTHLSRITAIHGDLAHPHFGLTQDIWHQLAQDIDAVYHCAATVNMVLPYQDLRASNITATQEVLRFCCEGNKKTLHHASTLSVFVATDQNEGQLLETDRLENTQTVYGGYAQTKWAAEWMLLQVPKDVCDIRHYRFGLITGDTKTGTCADTDFLAMFAKGISSLCTAPSGFDDLLHVDVTPIDYAAAAMAHISLHGTQDIYHIANPKSLSLGQLLAAIERKCGVIKRLPTDRWKNVAENISAKVEETAAHLSLCRCQPESFAQNRVMDLFQATNVVFDTKNTDAALKNTNLHCPPASDTLIDLYMDFVFKDEKKPVKICIFGPESTGKSTLAEKLAVHYKTAFVPEYAREVIFANDGDISLADIPNIAQGQIRNEKEALRHAHNVLFCDTDLITTTIWSDWLFKDCPQWIRDAAEAQSYDLYLLMDVDAPWVDDTHRFLPDERASFLAKCRDELERHDTKYTLISGNWEEKFEKAVHMVNATLRKL